MTTVPSDAPSLSGNVGQVATALLIAGVVVTADEMQVTTTPNGRYSFEDLEVGEVMLTAEYPGFETYTRRVRIREGRNTHDISMIPIP